MRIDNKIHVPRTNYVAEITITATKDELIRISNMLEQIQPEDKEDFKLIEGIKEEFDEPIRYLQSINA